MQDREGKSLNVYFSNNVEFRILSANKTIEELTKPLKKANILRKKNRFSLLLTV